MSTIPNTSHRQIKIDTSLRGKRKAEWSAVSVVVALDREHRLALASGDPAQLLAVAAKYLEKGMPNKAYQIRMEAGVKL